MSHRKATPETQRPTIENLQAKALLIAELENHTYEISGFWYAYKDEPPPEFKVTITGHEGDVQEVIETLKDNGNLHSLEFRRIK